MIFRIFRMDCPTICLGFRDPVSVRNKCGRDILQLEREDYFAVIALTLNENDERINPSRDTIVGDRVWVGYGANILKGARIGNDSVIGTQSVVAWNVSAGCVAVGNPVKVVKSGVYWCRERA